jgi:hypothetical protein
MFLSTLLRDIPKPSASTSTTPPPAPTTSTTLKPKPSVDPGDSFAVTSPAEPIPEEQLKADYKSQATDALQSDAAKKAMNAAIKEHGDGKPLTDQEIKKIVDNTDVKEVSPQQYNDLVKAAGGKFEGNPACGLSKKQREAIASPEGIKRLAASRHKGPGEPTQEELEKAAADLKKYDPGAFEKSPKDVVYVNEKFAKKGTNGDPNKTKVAAHEFMHVVLFAHGVPMSDDNGDIHHKVTGSLGWNASASKPPIPFETGNWNTGKGKGLTPP